MGRPYENMKYHFGATIVRHYEQKNKISTRHLTVLMFVLQLFMMTEKLKKG